MTATGDAPCADVFVGDERAADDGANAERLEVVVGHHLADHDLRAALDREVREEVRVRGDAGERFGAGAVVEIVGIRVRVVRIRRRLVPVDVDELVGALDRERAKENGVDDAEDRRVDADAEGQREERDERERRGTAQPAQRVADVLEEGFHGVCTMGRVPQFRYAPVLWPRHRRGLASMA